MDQLGCKRYCCRRMIMTHVDLIEKLLKYNPSERDAKRIALQNGELWEQIWCKHNKWRLIWRVWGYAWFGRSYGQRKIWWGCFFLVCDDKVVESANMSLTIKQAEEIAMARGTQVDSQVIEARVWKKCAGLWILRRTIFLKWDNTAIFAFQRYPVVNVSVWVEVGMSISACLLA